MDNQIDNAATWAALFDWDGVIIDSSAQHERSWELLAHEIGQPLPPDHFKRGFGRKNQIIIPEILGWADEPEKVRLLGERKEELYRELVAAEGVTVLPGSRELLAALEEAGIPRVVGSSTPRANLEALFEVTDLGSLLTASVSGDDVLHGKPDPEVFLKAAAKAGRPPERCVVFEDALAGLEAARRAGSKTVGVATTNPPEALVDADLVVHSLAGVGVAQLAGLFEQGYPASSSAG